MIKRREKIVYPRNKKYIADFIYDIYENVSPPQKKKNHPRATTAVEPVYHFNRREGFGRTTGRADEKRTGWRGRKKGRGGGGDD